MSARRDLLTSYIAETGRSRANNMAAFFRATFDAWKDYNAQRRGVVLRRLQPDHRRRRREDPRGPARAHVLHVVRNPWSAYADTKKRPVPLALDGYMLGWTLNQHYALLFAKTFPDRFHIVRAEDVMARSDRHARRAAARSSASRRPTRSRRRAGTARRWTRCTPGGRSARRRRRPTTPPRASSRTTSRPRSRARAWQYLEVFGYSGFLTSGVAEPRWHERTTRRCVTGAGGFVGAALARRLLAREHDVHGVCAPGSDRVAARGRSARRSPSTRSICATPRRCARPWTRHAPIGSSTWRPTALTPGRPIAGGIFESNLRGHDATCSSGRPARLRGVRATPAPPRSTASRTTPRPRSELPEPNSDYAVAKAAATLLCVHSRPWSGGCTWRRSGCTRSTGPLEDPARLVPTLVVARTPRPTAAARRPRRRPATSSTSKTSSTPSCSPAGVRGRARARSQRRQRGRDDARRRRSRRCGRSFGIDAEPEFRLDAARATGTRLAGSQTRRASPPGSAGWRSRRFAEGLATDGGLARERPDLWSRYGLGPSRSPRSPGG